MCFCMGGTASSREVAKSGGGMILDSLSGGLESLERQLLRKSAS